MGIKHLAQIPGMGECSTIVSNYYFVKETMIEELPSLTHYPLLPQNRDSLGYITQLRFPSLWIARKQAQEQRAAELPVAQSQKYGSRMASRHYDSMGNFAWIRKRQGRHVYLIHFQLEFLNIIVNLIFLSCLSYMSLSMPTLSSRMKFTFKKGFCHSHMEIFQRSSHTLLWNC